MRGGSGKTTLALGLCGAWRKQGLRVAPFKKGPDYIDAAWLAAAADRACHNLDSFMMKKEQVLCSFFHCTTDADLAVIEGNRGVFDGADVEGSHSTATLAKWLDSPVVLVVDCTKMSRTAAALVRGCQAFDPSLRIAGVILNRVGGARHQRILRGAIESECGLPVLGAVPNLETSVFPERHLGLVPRHEHPTALWAIDEAVAVAERHLDLDVIRQVAESVPPAPEPAVPASEAPPSAGGPVRIGVIRDSAFQFYYPENLEALRSLGAEIVFVNALEDERLPPVDALYIGGGFPETHARQLANNRSFRESVREAAEDELPIYAECGGLMFLGQSLLWQGDKFAMAGVLPVSFAVHKRPQGHGYAVVRVEAHNPFFPVGCEMRGHEFHYSKIAHTDEHALSFAFGVRRGHGFDGAHDGLCYKNVLATYVHLHALGAPNWAPSVLRRARERKATRS